MRIRIVFLACVLAILLARVVALAAGYAGRVMFGEVPVPGASVTATKGDRHVTTVTDERGVFTLADLDEGVWAIKVEMPTFAPVTREITIGAAVSPAAVWTLSLK